MARAKPNQPISERRLIIDELALKILRRPSAAPSLKPAEVIAIALVGTPWQERWLSESSAPVRAILKCLDDAGYKIEPK